MTFLNKNYKNLEDQNNLSLVYLILSMPTAQEIKKKKKLQ